MAGQHTNQRITQNAYIVRNLDQAIERWRETMGISPFYVFRHIEFRDVLYRGRAAELDISAAVAFAGDLQIELIEQHNAAPSAYRDVVPQGQEGFHHICVYPDDYDAVVARYKAKGFPVAGSGEVANSPGRRFCYIDTRPVMNCMLELVNAPHGADADWQELREATDNWDGISEPIREIEL